MAMVSDQQPARTSSFWIEKAVIAVAFLSLLILVVLPVGSLLIGSIWSQTGFSLEYFGAVLSDRMYVRALQNSLILGAFTALFSVVLGVPLAWAVGRTNVPGKWLIRLTVALAYLAPPFLTAIAFVNLFSPNAGIINVFLRDLFGSWVSPFNIYTMTGLVFVTVLHTFPFVYLLSAVAFESIDASYEEASQILGAGKLRTALVITAPLVAPAILSGTLMSFVNAIALFGSQAIIGMPGRIYTLPTRIYTLFDYPPQFGLASALSLIFIAITVLALYLQRVYLARRSFVTLSGKGARPQLVDLGGWRWLLLGFAVIAFFLAVVLPFGTLILMSFRASAGTGWFGLSLEHYKFVLFDYAITRRAIFNSLILATAAATITVILGTGISWVELRTRLRGRKILDYASLIPLGLPGIVMAVALVQFWLQMPVALYGTLGILLLAYVGRYIPLGVRAANSSFRQIDPSLEEASRILGAGWARTMGEIVVPLIRPGLFAGWLLVFVPVIQELSASILLFSANSITLAVAVYNLYEVGRPEPVAALAMVNMVVIGVAILVVRWFGARRAGVDIQD